MVGVETKKEVPEKIELGNGWRFEKTNAEVDGRPVSIYQLVNENKNLATPSNWQIKQELLSKKNLAIDVYRSADGRPYLKSEEFSKAFHSIVRAGEEVLLKPGSKIQLVANNESSPKYLVNYNDETPPRITLKLINPQINDPNSPQNLNAPETIERSEIKFGRNYDSFMNNDTISRQHAEIYQRDGQWYYRQDSTVNPARIVQPSLEEAVEIKNAARTNASLMQFDKSRMAKVMQLEGQTQLVMNTGVRDAGATIYDKISATQSRLYEVYRINNREFLTAEQNRNLEKTVKILEQIGDDDTYLRVQNSAVVQKYFENGIMTDPDSVDLLRASNYIDKKMLALQEGGEVFFNAGFRSHHAVASLSAENGKYYYTIYNAGYGTKYSGENRLEVPGQPDKAYVVQKYEIKDPSPENLKAILRGRARSLTLDHTDPMFQRINNFIADRYDPRLVDSVIDTAQRRGNCTTRSNREVLRYLLNDKTLADDIQTYARGADMEIWDENPDFINAAIEKYKQSLLAQEKASDNLILINNRPTGPLNPQAPGLKIPVEMPGNLNFTKIEQITTRENGSSLWQKIFNKDDNNIISRLYIDDMSPDNTKALMKLLEEEGLDPAFHYYQSPDVKGRSGVVIDLKDAAQDRLDSFLAGRQLTPPNSQLTPSEMPKPPYGFFDIRKPGQGGFANTDMLTAGQLNRFYEPVVNPLDLSGQDFKKSPFSSMAEFDVDNPYIPGEGIRLNEKPTGLRSKFSFAAEENSVFGQYIDDASRFSKPLNMPEGSPLFNFEVSKTNGFLDSKIVQKPLSALSGVFNSVGAGASKFGTAIENTFEALPAALKYSTTTYQGLFNNPIIQSTRLFSPATAKALGTTFLTGMETIGKYAPIVAIPLAAADLWIKSDGSARNGNQISPGTKVENLKGRFAFDAVIGTLGADIIDLVSGGKIDGSRVISDAVFGDSTAAAAQIVKAINHGKEIDAPLMDKILEEVKNSESSLSGIVNENRWRSNVSLFADYALKRKEAPGVNFEMVPATHFMFVFQDAKIIKELAGDSQYKWDNINNRIRELRSTPEWQKVGQGYLASAREYGWEMPVRTGNGLFYTAMDPTLFPNSPLVDRERMKNEFADNYKNALAERGQEFMRLYNFKDRKIFRDEAQEDFLSPTKIEIGNIGASLLKPKLGPANVQTISDPTLDSDEIRRMEINYAGETAKWRVDQFLDGNVKQEGVIPAVNRYYTEMVATIKQAYFGDYGAALRQAQEDIINNQKITENNARFGVQPNEEDRKMEQELIERRNNLLKDFSDNIITPAQTRYSSQRDAKIEWLRTSLNGEVYVLNDGASIGPKPTPIDNIDSYFSDIDGAKQTKLEDILTVTDVLTSREVVQSQKSAMILKP